MERASVEEATLGAVELRWGDRTSVAEAHQALELVRDRRLERPLADGQRLREALQVARLPGEPLRLPQHPQLEAAAGRAHVGHDAERPRLLRLRHEPEPAEQQPSV